MTGNSEWNNTRNYEHYYLDPIVHAQCKKSKLWLSTTWCNVAVALITYAGCSMQPTH